MKSIMIRGVIFDLDGVLVHTDELHFRAWSCIAEELGIPFDRGANDRLRGVSRAESLERLLALKPEVRLGDKEKAALCERKNSLYRASLETLTAADIPPAVRAVLEILRKRKLRLAVGSSSRNARLILQRTELEQAFDAVTDGTMITASKPDPEVFLRAAALLGLEPDVCAVVEDAPAGILAAHRAGMYAIGLGACATGDGIRPDVLLSHLTELPALPALGGEGSPPSRTGIR